MAVKQLSLKVWSGFSCVHLSVGLERMLVRYDCGQLNDDDAHLIRPSVVYKKRNINTF